MLLEKALAGAVQVAITQAILDEPLRVLRHKFEWSDRDLESARATIESCTHRVTCARTLNIIKEDEPDNRILECVEASGSEYIVSGDKDFHRLGQYGNARVIKVADMLDVLQGTGWRSPKQCPTPAYFPPKQ